MKNRKVAPKWAQLESKHLVKQYGGNFAGGWLAYLPTSWVPYVQLARLSPPAGLFLIYFPHLFGILHEAAAQALPVVDVLRACAILFVGSFFFSNTIHIWNDLVDAPIDKQVARTRQRPIPRGAVSPFAAFLFTVSQAVATALVLLLFMPANAVYYAAPNVVPTTYYPFAKRHTHFAQFVLGLWLAWGVIMGSVSFDTSQYPFDPMNLDFGISKSTLCLSLACILWTVIYDTIYAHQDLQDDTKIGMKSFAVLLREKTKLALSGVLATQVALLLTAGYLAETGLFYYLFAVGGTLASLGTMIARVNLTDSQSCWWWFRYGFWVTGGLTSVGLALEYIFN